MLDYLYTTQYQMRGIVAISLGEFYLSESSPNLSQTIIIRFNDVFVSVWWFFCCLICIEPGLTFTTYCESFHMLMLGRLYIYLENFSFFLDLYAVTFVGRIGNENLHKYSHAFYLRFQRKEDLVKFYQNPFYLGVLKEHVSPYCHVCPDM